MSGKVTSYMLNGYELRMAVQINTDFCFPGSLIIQWCNLPMGVNCLNPVNANFLTRHDSTFVFIFKIRNQPSLTFNRIFQCPSLQIPLQFSDPIGTTLVTSSACGRDILRDDSSTFWVCHHIHLLLCFSSF